MMQRMPKFIALAILLASVGVWSIAYAAPAYTVAPLVINEEAEARDIIKKDITLTNTGSQPVTIYPSVNNISLSDGGSISEFIPRVMSDSTASLAAWTEISRAGIQLATGESHTIPITFRIHPFPQPGEYHAFIGFGYGRTADDAKEMVTNGRAPGTVATITIVEEKSELLKLSQFFIDTFITASENESVEYVLTNPGDTPLVPSGDIIFYDGRGVEVASLPVNPDGNSLAPGEKKSFTATAPVDGLFGKYKGYLSVEYGDAQLASVQDTVFFYVLPLPTILTIFGVILALTILAAYFVHRRYFDNDEFEDADVLPVRVRESQSSAHERDVDLTSRQ